MQFIVGPKEQLVSKLLSSPDKNQHDGKKITAKTVNS